MTTSFIWVKVLERDDPEKEMSISFMQKGKLEGHYRWP
jgi:hypothetical protein